MCIKENLVKLFEEIPVNITIVAVSKTKPLKDILEAYNSGQKIFGENKAQEIIRKQPLLPEDINWHFIGHLQTNKVKYLAPFVNLIHSIDSLKLIKEINKEAKKNNRVIDCLLQFHIATEESKFGFDFDEASEILESPLFNIFENIRIIGVMGMATFTNNEELIRNELKLLKNYFDKLKTTYFSNIEYFKEISMGMSSDYKIAIEEGSTMVRIGSSIFSARN